MSAKCLCALAILFTCTVSLKADLVMNNPDQVVPDLPRETSTAGRTSDGTMEVPNDHVPLPGLTGVNGSVRNIDGFLQERDRSLMAGLTVREALNSTFMGRGIVSIDDVPDSMLGLGLVNLHNAPFPVNDIRGGGGPTAPRAIPEPGSLAALVAGGIMLLLRRRSR
jgi:hypothetical protein